MSDGVWQYFAVFGSLILAGMGFPIPDELPLIAGGVAAGRAAHDIPQTYPYWYIMLPVCWIGVILSDTVLYSLGRFGGRRLLKIQWVQARLLPVEKQRKIESHVEEHGVKILLGARFMPGIRAPIFFMAGVMHMPITRFMLADGIYAIPGVAILFGLSYYGTDTFMDVYKHLENKVNAVRNIIILLVIAAAAGAFAWA